MSGFVASDTRQRIAIAVLSIGEGGGDIQEEVKGGSLHHIHGKRHPSFPAFFSFPALFVWEVCLFDGEGSEVNESVFRLRHVGKIQETLTMMNHPCHVIGIDHRMTINTVGFIIHMMTVENHSCGIPMRLGKEEGLAIEMSVFSTKTSISNVIGK